MKQFTIILLAIFFSVQHVHSQSVKAMSYNIRLNTSSDGENAWPNRKDFLRTQVLFFAPDFLGVQEATPEQMTHLKSVLKDYMSIGQGRDGVNKGEFSAIFYNTKRFKLEENHMFWLSESPEHISKGWDAAYPRVCTYGLFTDLETSKKIWVFNTHLDHKGHQAQLQGMKLIQDTIAKVNTANYPVILTGDFNVEPDSELITNLSKSMVNTQDLADLIYGPKGTFSGFKFHEPVTRTIDYIFTSKPAKIKVTKHAVLSDSDNLKYPSDHFPIFIEFTLD